MTGNEYQALAMRTNDGKSTDRVISGVLTCDLKWLHNQNVVREDTEGLDLGGVLNGCLGLAGESGEVLDGYTLDFHMIVPRGMSIDEVVDMWSESWEEKVNESCTSRV